MLLLLLLDALAAVGEAKALALLAKLLFLGLLPLVLLIYLLGQLANLRLDERLDHEWTEHKAQITAAKRHKILFLLVLCGVFMIVTKCGWSASD